MRLILTLLIRDEVDIIQSTIDFHMAMGVDHIIITDNGSIDGTYEICEAYAKRGIITLLTEPPSDFSQHRWVTNMANMAYLKYDADWVVNADADEFFVPTAKGLSLKDTLRNVPRQITALNILRHDFISNSRPMEKSPPIEMIYRKVNSLNLRGQPLPPKVIHRGSPNTIISQGNHGAKGDYITIPEVTNAIAVYHYPIRSYNQFFNKVNNGGSGYSKNKELPKAMGFHKRYWYNLLLEEKLELLYEKEYHITDEKLNELIKNGLVIEDLHVSAMMSKILQITF